MGGGGQATLMKGAGVVGVVVVRVCVCVWVVGGVARDGFAAIKEKHMSGGVSAPGWT